MWYSVFIVLTLWKLFPLVEIGEISILFYLSVHSTVTTHEGIFTCGIQATN